MNALEYYAQLARQQEQQVPQGNPIAEYLNDRANLKELEGAAQLSAAPLLAGTGLGMMSTGNIPLGLLMLLSGGASGLGAGLSATQAGRLNNGSEMWANRFGEGDPSQGMPGTPSGPAWRR